MTKLFTPPAETLTRYRAELLAHCYRLMGSLHDAEDVLQDAYERAWSSRDAIAEGSSERAWLYRIATNVCLDRLRRQKLVRSLPIGSGPRIGPADETPPNAGAEEWVGPFPDRLLEEGGPEAKYLSTESVRLAFVTALQRLTPRERAVLVLRDVLGWSAKEVAETLAARVPAVESALHRARQAVGRARRRGRTGAGGPRERKLLERYVRAWERRDVSALTELLASGVTFSMPPNPAWLRGRKNVLQYLARIVLVPSRERRFVFTRANGTAAFGVYLRATDSSGPFEPHSVQVLTMSRGRVSDIVSFKDPELFAPFGLPASVR